jgi:soluble lytic murein transglycosylase-like protein
MAKKILGMWDTSGYNVGKNKLPVLCFILAALGPLVFPAASAGLAARAVVRADASSGRLVRRVVPVASGPERGASFWRKQAQVDELVARAAEKYSVDPLLVHAIIEVESDYNPFAVSPKGATGLMQLMAATARRFGASNRFAPWENIEAGVRYLKHLANLFQDDGLALAAYNAGEGAVFKYNAIPPYAETRSYVERVRARYEELRRQARAAAPPATQSPYRPLEAFLGPDGKLHMRTR